MTKRRPGRGGVLLGFRRKTGKSRAQEFGDTGRRLRQERELAAPVVERLLRTTPRDQWPALSERPDLQTLGALERLGNLFAATLTKEPREALAIAELAVAAAEGLPPGAYPTPIPAQLRAHAWKDYGKALRFLGRNLEALEAFDQAEEEADGPIALAHDLAIVRFNRAMSLQELERFEESRKLLAECKEVFDDHGDTRNVILCGLAEGVLLQRLRTFREAREVYVLLFASASDMDTETRAALHRVIGMCSIELADFRDAELNLNRAVALSATLGQPVEVLKNQRCLGSLFIRRGDVEDGVAHLRMTRREFLRSGLPEEAGLCGLDIVEGLLLVDRASAAETLARRVIEEFTAAGLSRRAIAALGYLTEAIARKKASVRLVTEVRDYIVSLRTAPERDFVASS
jgi:tetratricopeptide (TPR) repeat protein